jgi:hypothetical protein
VGLDAISIPADAAVVANDFVELIAAICAVVGSVAHDPLDVRGIVAADAAVAQAAIPFPSGRSCGGLIACNERAHLSPGLGQRLCLASVQLDAHLLGFDLEPIVSVDFSGAVAGYSPDVKTTA